MRKLLSPTTCLLQRDEGILLSEFPNNTASEISGFSFIRFSFVLSVRQEAVNTVFDVFGMTRRGTQTQVYQLQSEPSSRHIALCLR